MVPENNCVPYIIIDSRSNGKIEPETCIWGIATMMDHFDKCAIRETILVSEGWKMTLTV
jgi:hypothetical protein